MAQSRLRAVVTLQLYILRQLLVCLTFSVGGMIFIAIPGLAVSAVQRLGGTGASALLRYLPLAFADLLPYMLPLGFLLATVTTYGRLAADGEWTAILMAGFHPLRMLIPPCLVALVLTAGTGWLLSEVTPHLAEQRKAFMRDSATRALQTLNPGRTDLAFGEFQLISRYREGEYFWDVYIQLPEVDGGTLAMRAERARIWFPSEAELAVDLEHCQAVMRAGETSFSSKNDALEVRVPLDRIFESRPVGRTRPKYWTNGELLEKLLDGTAPEGKQHRWWWELHRRLAASASYFMFILLGVSTGLLMRRGTGLGALACSVGYGLVYYLLSLRVGRELSEAQAIPAWIGAWATNALGTALGIYLLLRALRH